MVEIRREIAGEGIANGNNDGTMRLKIDKISTCSSH